LDEVVKLENSPGADGNFQQHYFPVYDETGNMVAATGQDGKPVEKYAYSPYGEQTVTVDLTPPAVEQVRIKDGAIWLEMSEEVSIGALNRGLADHKLTLKDLGTQQDLVIQAVLPVQDGRQARRRISIVPGTAPAAGAQLHLSIQREAIKDLFLNKLAAAYDLDITWPEAGAVLADSKPPALDIIGIADGKLRIGLTEEPDPATFDAIQVDGSAITWTLSDDHYTLTTNSTLGSGSHTLTIGTALKDLGGNSLADAYTNTFSLQGANDARTLFALPDPRQIPLSAIKNTLGFHGQPKDLETGFVYMRNRYYDPQLGRFITIDPLSYVDGPNPYGFVKNDPVNHIDPLGLSCLGIGILDCKEIAGSFLGADAAKRSAEFFGGYTVGAVKTVGAVGVVMYNETGSLLYKNTGNYKYRAQYEESQRIHAEVGKAVQSPASVTKFVLDGVSQSIDKAKIAAEKGDYWGVGEGTGSFVTQTAMLADAANGMTPTVAPAPALATTTGIVAQTGSVVLTGGGDALGNGVSLMSKSVDAGDSRPDLPKRDPTGKIHNDLPKLEDLRYYDTEDLGYFLDELKASIQKRIEVTEEKGSDVGHARRQTEEQQLAKAVEKQLEKRNEPPQ
jgi:RHS repeat-associated protein